MKKLTVLLLVLVLCLGLTACASESEDEKALAAANALLEAGDYEAALDAYYEIPIYQQIGAKIDEAYARIVAAKVVPYVGTWKDLNNEVVLTIRADGTMLESNEFGDTLESMVGYDGERIWLYGDAELVEIDGITHLKNEYSDFVSAEDYEVLSAKPVEITLENWETYFELREAKAVYYSDAGEVNHVSMGYGVFLRDEYVEKLKNEWDSVNVTFKMQYEEAHYYIEGDYPNGEYYLGEQFVDPWYVYETREAEQQVGSYFYEDAQMVSDFSGHYAADFAYGHISDWDSKTQTNRYNACVPIDPQIMEVTGTLLLFP